MIVWKKERRLSERSDSDEKCQVISDYSINSIHPAGRAADCSRDRHL
jgi:hypothetical protein